MLNLVTGSRIYIHTAVTDMRKGVHGLSGIVRSEFASDPTDGSLFVFINRRRNRMKILFFDGGGFWLYYRLLESGTFEELKRASDAKYMTIDATQLSMLLSGVPLAASHRRRKRYAKRENTQAA